LIRKKASRHQGIEEEEEGKKGGSEEKTFADCGDYWRGF